MYEIDGNLVGSFASEEEAIDWYLDDEHGGSVRDYPAQLTVARWVVATKRDIDVRDFVRENYDEDALRTYDEAHRYDEEDRC